MTVTVALFNNKGGVGKTTLTYHLAHMMARLGHRVLAVDLDPQANLTAEFLDEPDLAELWGEPSSPAWRDVSLRYTQSRFSQLGERVSTIASAVRPLRDQLGDIALFEPVRIQERLWLVPGDLDLSGFEDRLSDAWPRGYTGRDEGALRVTSAFHRAIRHASDSVGADVVLLDVGPNLGAINRSALLAADTVVVPMAADLFSLRGLHNLGPTLREWRNDWQSLVLPKAPGSVDLPRGTMEPIGYVIMQPIMRLDRPVVAYRIWLDRIPAVFDEAVLDQLPSSGEEHPYEIMTLRNYRSLMPLAHDARKPMFDLRAADGALGSTARFVQQCYQDFERLSEEILRRLEDWRSRQPSPAADSRPLTP